MDLRDIIWITSAIGIAAVYLLWHTHKKKESSVEILDLEFDRHSRRLELTVKNPDIRPNNIKSALRLVRYRSGETQFTSEGVPMMAGRIQSTNVLGFDLLAADDHTTLLRGKTQEKFVYVIPENIILKPNDNIRVDVSSDREHTSTVVPLRFKEDLMDVVVEVDQDIEKIIGEIDKRINSIEKKELTGADEIKRFRLLWEEEILKDIEKELLVGKQKVDESISQLIGFTYGVGLSVDIAS